MLCTAASMRTADYHQLQDALLEGLEFAKHVATHTAIGDQRARSGNQHKQIADAIDNMYYTPAWL